MNKRHTSIRARMTTKRNFDFIAGQKGWKVAEAVDRAAKALAKQERIKLPAVEQLAALAG
jgi:hypothetical protein